MDETIAWENLLKRAKATQLKKLIIEKGKPFKTLDTKLFHRLVERIECLSRI